MSGRSHSRDLHDVLNAVPGSVGPEHRYRPPGFVCIRGQGEQQNEQGHMSSIHPTHTSGHVM